MSLSQQVSPPLSAEDFIKMVQTERSQMPEWTTAAHGEWQNGSTGNSGKLGKSEKRWQQDQQIDSASSECAVDRESELPNGIMPSAGWIRETLENAERVRKGLLKSPSRLGITLPTIQSKKDHFKLLVCNHPKRAAAIIPAMSQPIILRFLKHLIEWVASYTTTTATASDIKIAINRGEENEDEIAENEDGLESDRNVADTEKTAFPKSNPAQSVESIEILDYLQWIYFLLCKCDPLLEADDVYTIRTLCKTLIKKRLEFWIAYAAAITMPKDQPMHEDDEELEEGEEREQVDPSSASNMKADPVFVYFTLCIMLITRGWYGQKDLQDPLRII